MSNPTQGQPKRIPYGVADYGRLRHLMAIDRRLNGNFSLLKKIIEEGETTSPINPKGWELVYAAEVADNAAS